MNSKTKHFTLTRLLCQKTKDWPKEFYLGGNILHTKTNVYLTDQSFSVKLSTDNTAELSGWVEFKISNSDLSFEKDEWLLSGFSEFTQHAQAKTSAKKPISPSFNPKLFIRWNEFLNDVRSYLSSQSLQEVTTPSLVVNPGPEPTLEPFKTSLITPAGRRQVYLPTSPELSLKKLISQGFTDIFEISRSFRNEELSPIHEPEFTMLEWYRGFYSLQDLMSETEEFLKHFAAKVNKSMSFDRAKIVSVAELFKSLVEFNLTPNTTHNELQDVCLRLGLSTDESDSWNDLFFRVMLDFIEPKIAKLSEPVMVHSYPPSLAALAKKSPEGWANRFEVYWRGVELANAFDELTNPEEQRLRFIEDNLEKLTLGRDVLPLDEYFIGSLELGLPPTAGIAMGLERLFCVLMECGPIQSIKPFNWQFQTEQDS